jgi:hypothetical protein
MGDLYHEHDHEYFKSSIQSEMRDGGVVITQTVQWKHSGSSNAHVYLVEPFHARALRDWLNDQELD